MAQVQFKLHEGFLATEVAWRNRKTPMPVYFRLGPRHAAVANEIARRISRDAVQDRLEKHLGIGCNYIDKVTSVSISNEYPSDCIAMDPKAFQIKISYDEARSLHGNKVAVVLSGGSDRALAHVGILLALAEAGIPIDYLIGTSGGSIIAALMALHGDAKKVQEAVKKVMQEYTYQDLLDLDLVGIRDDSSRFFGFIAGNRLVRAIKNIGVGDSTFKDTKIKLAIIGADISTCRTFVFGDHGWLNEELSVDPTSLKSDTFAQDMHQIFPNPNPRIAEDAIRSSISIPLAFETNDISHNGEHYRFMDGGLGDNCPIKTAANIIDVGSIIAINLGYPESAKTEGSASRSKGQAVKDLLMLIDYMGVVQMKATLNNAELLRGLQSVRVINPAIFIETPTAFMRAQDTMLSSRETMRKVFKIMGDRFFSKWNEGMVALARKNGLAPKIYCPNSPDSNIVAIRDLNPLISKDQSSPIWGALYSEDGGKVMPKAIKRSPAKWLLSDAIEVWGKARIYLSGACLWAASKLLFRKKK